MTKELIGKCGLFCGACDNYVAFTKEGKHLLETAKYKDMDHEPLKCKGCNSDSLSEHCSKCEIMKCANKKEYLFCGECDKFPCSLIMNFYNEGKKWDFAKHRLDILKNTDKLKSNDVEKWIKESQERWTCECGKGYTYYEEKCVNCGKDLNSYIKP